MYTMRPRGLDVPERKVVALDRFYAAALTGLSADRLSEGMKGEPPPIPSDSLPFVRSC